MLRKSRRDVLSGVVALGLGAGERAVAQVGPKKPKPPIGRDPGGLAVAILGAGVDYLRPDIAARLARDGEGEIIAWDILDDDDRPLERPADRGLFPPPFAGTDMALHLLATAPRTRLIPVRVQDRNAMALGGALAFVAKTPARIAVVLGGGEPSGPWKLFADVAAKAPHLLIVASAGPFLRDMTAASPVSALDNVLVAGLDDPAGAGDPRIGVRLTAGDLAPEAAALMAGGVPGDHLVALRLAAEAAEIAARSAGLLAGATMRERVVARYGKALER